MLFYYFYLAARLAAMILSATPVSYTRQELLTLHTQILVGSVLLIVLVLCVVFCLSSSCVMCPQCFQCLWIVHLDCYFTSAFCYVPLIYICIHSCLKPIKTSFKSGHWNSRAHNSTSQQFVFIKVIFTINSDCVWVHLRFLVRFALLDL